MITKFPSPNDPFAPASKLGDQVLKVLSGLGKKRDFLGWSVVERWREIAGERIAGISEAERYEDGILYIHVEKAIWRHSLSMESDTMLDAIAEKVGKGIVTKIHFR